MSEFKSDSYCDWFARDKDFTDHFTFAMYAAKSKQASDANSAPG